MRRLIHGEPAETKYHRNASDPNEVKISHGSTTLPLDFDIFCPSGSTRSARQTTLRYGDWPNTSVFTASSE